MRQAQNERKHLGKSCIVCGDPVVYGSGETQYCSVCYNRKPLSTMNSLEDNPATTRPATY